MFVLVQIHVQLSLLNTESSSFAAQFKLYSIQMRWGRFTAIEGQNESACCFFGRTWRTRRLAVKNIRFIRSIQCKKKRIQVFLLQTLSHPYIVAYRDSFLIEGVCDLAAESKVHGDRKTPRRTRW